MKIQNIQNNITYPKYILTQKKSTNAQPSFEANPVKPINKYSNLEKLAFRVINHFKIKNFVEESTVTVKQLCQKYINDKGFICENRIKTPIEMIAHGFYEPFTNCIYINKNMIKNCAIFKYLGHNEDFEKLTHRFLLSTPIHETQHKIQAIQIFRLPGKKEYLINLLKQSTNKLEIILNRLKKNNVHKERIIELNEELKITTDKSKKTTLKKELKKQKALAKYLSKYLEDKQKEIKNFDLDKTLSEFETILKQKGEIKKGSEEEILALKYLEAHENYPIILEKFLPPSDFPSKEAYTKHLENISASYTNNFLEIDANQKAAEYIEENKNLIEAMYLRLKEL